MSLAIAHRHIGPDHPALVIAEIGVNHDGSTPRALQLVDHAASAGADAVKLQFFHADALLHPSASFAAYQKSRSPDPSLISMLRRYELPPDDLLRIVSAIRSANMLPLATPFSLPDIDQIERLDLPAIKIASPDLVNYPLLRRAAQTRRPLLLSTGAATIDEVAATVQWLTDWRVPFALLHCISAYPTSPPDANLSWIAELSHRFSVPVGLSDHTTELLSGPLAIAFGASVIEKHLTYDRSAPGPDHSSSFDPSQFTRYVHSIRLAETLKGAPPKRLLPIEQDIRLLSRQSLVLTRPLAAGQPISEDDLTTQRPATGIPAVMFLQVLALRSTGPLPSGTLLQWSMLEPRPAPAPPRP